MKPHPVKDAGGWAAEKLGRLKPNNRLLGYSPLSRVLELEGLLIGVTGKLALWEALRDSLGDSLDGVDFVALGDRAQEQRARLEEMRRRAAVEAFKRTEPGAQPSSVKARRASDGSAKTWTEATLPPRIVHSQAFEESRKPRSCQARTRPNTSTRSSSSGLNCCG